MRFVHQASANTPSLMYQAITMGSRLCVPCAAVRSSVTERRACSSQSRRPISWVASYIHRTDDMSLKTSLTRHSFRTVRDLQRINSASSCVVFNQPHTRRTHQRHHGSLLAFRIHIGDRQRFRTTASYRRDSGSRCRTARAIVQRRMVCGRWNGV